MSIEFFKDRNDAGRQLAMALDPLKDETDVLVLALPRGGVPVAYEVAARLGAPLDVLIVRKLGVPGHVELAMGAVASGGMRVFNQEVINDLNLPPQIIARVLGHAEEEVEEREKRFRDDYPFPEVEDRSVILVDDGLATGSTMLAAVRALKQKHPRRILVAVPVGPDATCRKVANEVDGLVCLYRPEPFYGVGLWYDDFQQTTDEEVRELLMRAHRKAGPITSGGSTQPRA